MKLYVSPLACSRAPHIVLIELGIEHSIEAVDLRAQPHVVRSSGAPYSAVNPKGLVPALQLESGEVLSENAVILQYLADQRPDSGLLPRMGTMARYHAMEWLSYLSSDVHKSFSPLWNPSLPEVARPVLEQSLARRLVYLDRHLADRPHLTGERFGVADAYLFALSAWMPLLGLDRSRYPGLERHHQRVGARASVRRMLEAEPRAR